MLTTIDLPVVSHVTRASGAEPFLGMMLTLDVRSIVQMASEMDEPRPRREDASRSISFEVLDADLLDALVRLVKLLGQPALVPGLAPLIQQEIILRLLTGPHGPQLRRLVTAGSPSQQIAKAVAWLKQNFVADAGRRRLGGSRAHEPLDLPAAFPRPHWREPVAVPEAIASAGSTAVDAEREPRRGQCRRARRVRKPVAIQSRIPSPVWRAASARCHAHAARSRYWRREPTSNGSRGPRLVEPLHAIDRPDRRWDPDELTVLPGLQRTDREELGRGHATGQASAAANCLSAAQAASLLTDCAKPWRTYQEQAISGFYMWICANVQPGSHPPPR